MISNDTKQQAVVKDTDNGRFQQLRNGTPYTIKTGLDLPDLFQQTTALNSALWPGFIQENPTTENFYELYARFPAYQFALVTEQGTLIAVGNSVPLAWDGKPHDLPAGGWDWAYKRAFADDDNSKTPTIQSALAITVAPEFLGQGVSREAILAMKAIGEEAGLSALIAPVRPNQKHAYPLIDIYDYLKWLRDDGQPFDAWVRTHTKLGGKIIKPALRSMHITGSVADWEKWSGLKMPKSGQYIVPKALVPVNIDVENDLGIYLEPNVWIWHPMNVPVPEQEKVAAPTLSQQKPISLTAEQRQIWFAEQLHPDTSMYNNGFLFSLEGDINYPKFNQAFQTLVNHTDILRTIIVEENGEPVQSLTDVNVSLELLEDIADVKAWAEARTSHHRFDMSQPMFDSALLQSSDGKWHWYISLHHIIGDGWTLQLLLERLSALYAQGKSASNNWPQFLPVADTVNQTNNPKADAYWREKVGRKLDEPTFYGAKSKSTSTQFERIWVDLGTERTAKLHETLQHEQIFVTNKNITLYNSMMAVTATWLSRIGNLTDFAIGSPLLTRPTADLRQTAGMISRYVPLHFHIDAQASFVSLVQQVATEARVCNKHNVVSVPSEGGKRPFSVSLNLRPLRHQTFADHTIQSYWPSPNHSLNDLSIQLLHDADNERIQLAFDFNEAHFDDEGKASAIRHFTTLIDSLIADPQQPIATAPMLSDAEKKEILLDWNDTERTYPIHATAHELFEIQAAYSPNAVALKFGDQQLSYGELNERANQLAHYLREEGIVADTLVAVYTERSFETIISMLAVLKAGGAYVSLDPSNPASRTAYMLKDADVSLILTQSKLKQQLPETCATKISLDTWFKENPYATENLDPISEPTDLAYVIYTSGSTGQPKGVMVEHRNAVNLIFWMKEAFPIGVNDRLLQKTPYSFDVSVREILFTLSTGATLVLAKHDGHKDAAYLAEVIEQEQISTLHFVPSLLSLFLQAATREQTKSLKWITSGGEALAPDLRDKVWAKFGVPVINMYGPTEAAVDVTLYNCDPDKPRDVVPIGFPTPNSQLYILDNQLNPVPAGVTGDLYIGGAQVARGYLNREALTAERFIEVKSGKWEVESDSSFTLHPSSLRLYKTGDLARYASDGAIIYVGRSDFQVKLRGYRIELGEIAATLLAHDGVRESAVIVRNDNIVAYIVPEQAMPSDDSLRTHCDTNLPDYMMPAAFVELDVLPLTPNGKLDRRALPNPDFATVATDNYVAPATALENSLAFIWGKILDQDTISTTANFFHLGGHSLLATRIINEINALLQTDLSLAAIFQAPTIQQLAQLIGTAQTDDIGADKRHVPQLDYTQSHPLSPAQERLWYAYKLDPTDVAYNVSIFLKLSGKLDKSALDMAFAELIQRHAILRTVIVEQDEQPLQRIADVAAFTLDAVSVSDLAEVEALGSGFNNRPFSLTADFPIRAQLLHLENSSTYLLQTTFHHIAFDGWSSQLFEQELGALYAEFADKTTANLPDLPIQYIDYANSAKAWQESDAHDRQLAYWKNQLAELPTLDLPTDLPRPAVQSNSGNIYRLTLPDAVRDAVNKFSQAKGISKFAALSAIFNLLLNRYTGQTDVPIGIPMANRPDSDSEKLIGFFVNSIVLRTQIGEDETFATLAQNVSETIIEGFGNQQVSFNTLVSELVTQRDPSRHPLFQVMFDFQTAGDRKRPFGSLTAETFHQDWQTAKFDLDFSIRDGQDDMQVWVEYNTDLFKPSTIERMVNHFATLIVSATDQPNAPISALSLLSPAEKQFILHTVNDTQIALPAATSIVPLFEDMVAQHGAETALVHDTASLTYQQLNERVNQLAHFLQANGVITNTPVGLHVDRSIEMIVGMLAVLKSGGSYVPLDPNYPQDRLAYIIQEANITLILTQSIHKNHLPSCQQIVALDNVDLFAQSATDNLPTTHNKDDIAYIIFTSGSTGKPKGVQVRHHGLLNHALAIQDTFDLTHTDHVLQFASISFDVAGEEIFPTLLSGATLVLRTDSIMNSFESFEQFMNTHKISVANLPTPFWQTWVTALADGDTQLPDALRLMVIGSDKASPQSVQKWFATVGDRVRWLNAYGLTETTITSTIYEPAPNEDLNVAIVPIGKPIGNTQIYILDEQLNPVPLGATGTLFIGGLGLAHGYLNRDALTAERFIEVESGKWGVGSDDGSSLRLYETGDLARLRPDGNIEFLGRSDFQVKIRGFRVELGEIEAAINEESAVNECIVIDHKDDKERVSLIAYLVADPDLDLNQLHYHLENKLPPYMVPNTFMRLEKMPHTLNGKIDRKQLPDPAERQQVAKSAVPPKNQLEATLIDIWSEVLGVPVQRDDNYFQLGGDSILSIRIISRARKAGIQFTPKALFENPTIARLRHVAKQSTQQKPNPIESSPLEGSANLLPIQHWFFEQLIPNPHHWNMASLFAVSADFDTTIFDQALSHIVQHHDALRLRFAKTEQGWTQAYVNTTHLAETTRVDLRGQSDPQKRIQETAETLHNSLNIHNGSLIRAVHFSLPDGTFKLLIIIHHLVVDGVSWRILREDLETAYAQLSANKAVELPQKTTSVRSWADQLKGHANSFALIDDQKYWSALSTVRYRPLPLDFNVPHANTVGKSAIISKTLDKQTTDALLKVVPTAYNTQINDALLTALSLTMQQWTGQSDQLIAMEGHGREDIGSNADLSRTVGWLTSQYPVYLSLNEPDNLGNSLKQIKEQLRAVPTNGLSFDALRYLHRSNDVRLDLFNMPTPQLLFNYLGQMGNGEETSLLTPIKGEIGEPFDLDSQRSTLLDLNAVVINGELTLNWRYSTTHHLPQTIASLADTYIGQLRALVAHCQQPENSGVTPSDFPDAALNQAELDALLGDIEPTTIESIFPLSPMQEGMLFHSLQSEGSSYFAQTQYFVHGAVDVAAFKQAFATIYQRHAALRTQVVWQKLERPLQIVLKQVAPIWHEYDWRDLNDVDRTTDLFELLGQDKQLGIDLSTAPLGRLYLIRLEDELYHFIRSSHHITGDGWSGGVMFSDFHNLYEAYTNDTPVTLAPTRSYHDFIRWLNKQDHHASETFWRKELEGFSAPTPLVIDKPARNDEHNKTYSDLLKHFPTDFSAQLRTFAKQQELTPNTLVQAAWGMLLNRYSQENDVLFGATVSGRPADLDDVENMMGAFINTVPIRINVDENQPLRYFLRELQQRQAVLNQYEHESLVNMQAWSDVPRDEPLFETILVVESFAIGHKKQADDKAISIESIDLNTTTGYPLTFAVNPSGDWELKMVYENGRFSPSNIERLLTHFQTLLNSIISAPDSATLGSLNMLPQDEIAHILQVTNNQAITHLAEESVIETFELTAAILPDSIALSQDDHTFTYRQLNERVNQLARSLVANGITPETYVGLYVNRSPELIIAMFAILKAGGAFIIMDPDYPQSRIAHMINDSGLKTIITTNALAEKLPETTATIQSLDDTDLDLFSTENLDEKPASDQLAYLLYTSGSTGKPKGVMIEHGSLLNLAEHYHQSMNITSDTCLLQFSALGFDASIMDIFSCFSGGGRLAMRTDDMVNVSTFVEKITEWGVTNVLLPTAFWHELTAVLHEQPELKLPSTLRHVIVGGEKALRQRLALWQEMVGDSIHLYNAYGPTEITVAATMVELTPKDLDTERELSIGHPLTNVDMYILDKQQRILPIGVAGELHIGGVQVARGYWQRPELTADKFVELDSEKWAVGSGNRRVYKTGDLVRFWPDGHLEFLGRTDNQVKVRGFRIELGGIESALTEHPQVQDCAVIAVTAGENDTRLAAYIVTHAGKAIETADLRTFLKQTLPNYMIPATFMTLNSLPMTPGGKINRKALPEPNFTTTNTAEHMSPRNQTEQTLLTIWEELLNVTNISIHDDWFDLGGHSLMAVRMTARLDKAIGETLSVNALAEHRTIAQLATVIDAKEVNSTWSLVVPLEKGGDKPPFFMIHANSGVLFYRKITQYLSPDQPVFGIQAPGINDGEYIPETIEEKVALYIKEIQRIQPTGPYYFGGYSLGGILAYEMAQQFTAMGEEVGLAAIIETGPNYTRYARIETLAQKAKRNIDNQLLRLRALGTAERQLDYIKRRTRARIAAYRGRRLQGDLQDKSLAELTLPQRYDIIKFQMVEAVSSYKIKPYIGQITAFKAEMQPPAGPRSENYLTWDDLVQSGVAWCIVPGDHGSILERPAHAEQLAKKLQTALNNASLKHDVLKHTTL